MDLPIPTSFAPMEARRAAELPADGTWQFEPKWDGFRCLAFRDGHEVELRAKSGKPLARYFPEMVESLLALPARRFVLDGELVIEGRGFDALQMRLHPAESRIRRLAAETPAVLVLFDCLLGPDDEVLTGAPLGVRRAALEAFALGPSLRLTPFTRDLAEARRWLERTGGALDGVIAKPLGPYVSGERAMLKVKRLHTADCVVGGFRHETDSPYVASLLLGLYDEAGRLDHVGFTSTITDAERPGLTLRLEALAGGPGFTGKAPGGPSRWTTERTAEWTPLRPELVVEVRYDQVTGRRFRHGTKLVRWRPDKAPRQCGFDQIERSGGPVQEAEQGGLAGLG